MKKSLAEYFALVVLLFSFFLFREKLGFYLLQEELSSDKKVNEIIALANQPEEFWEEPIFNNQKIVLDPYELEELAEITSQAQQNVLGEASGRWIEINLSQQRLYAWEDSNLIYNYLVSTGKWAPTPTGNFRIWIKLAKTKMSGGSKALGTYYYLPNVPCTMYFYKGYGIHGTYWHNNFGHPMSHGCVNMRTSEACVLFNWASVGTLVNIHY